MAIDFCGIQLEHRLVNASGTWDPIAALAAFGEAAFSDFPFAAHVTKTITVQPRLGNPAPRLWELPAGLMNSIGLPNKGIDRWIEEDLPVLADLPVPLIVNVMGATSEDLELLVNRTTSDTPAVAIELNVSCPNVKSGLMIGADPDECSRVVAAVRARTDLPLIVKITPNATDPAAVAAAAVGAGADAISMINTLKGLAFNPSTGEPWLGGITGGVSGPGIRNVALAQVASVRAAVAVPIIGMGGVSTGPDADNMRRAGADLIAIGTASFRDPRAADQIRSKMALGD
jgi:dihydroorotate dehydrogenase (NAD+) catalytic subunit